MVLIPKYSNYYIFSVYVVGLKQVQLRVEGKPIAISNITVRPVMDGDYQSVLYFSNCSDFTLTGPGMIDGQGYRWWVELMFNFLQHNRPRLVYFQSCINVLVENLTLLNAPQFHVYAKPIKNFTV